MASRTFQEKRFTLLKGVVDVYAVVNVGAGGSLTTTGNGLQQWNYPSLGQVGSVSRTYSAAATTGGTATWPSRNAQGEAGVFSVARTAAGLWTVTLQDTYERLLGIAGYSTLAGGLSAIVAYNANSTITNMAATGGSVIGVALCSATATALDPASGEQICLHFTLSNASEP